MYHTYKFINVVQYAKYKHNKDSIVFSNNNNKYVLDISLEQMSKYSYLTKEECIEKANVRKDAWYLYKHDGKYGRYNIETQIFEQFDDIDGEAKVHSFYYNTVSLFDAGGYQIY